MHQPGEGWMYNTGSLLLGVLIARASGRRFDAFLRERIIEPLGMRDTDFFVPKGKLDRFAGCGNYTDEKGAVTRMDRDGAQSAYATPPAFPFQVPRPPSRPSTIISRLPVCCSREVSTMAAES